MGKLNLSKVVLTILTFFFIFIIGSGCSQKEQKQPIKEGMTEIHAFIDTIEDEVRKRKLNNILSDMEQSLTRFYEVSQSVQKNIQTLNRDYDAKRESFEVEFARLESEQVDMQESVLNTYFHMRVLCQPEEWKQIRKIHHDSAIMYLESKGL